MKDTRWKPVEWTPEMDIALRDLRSLGLGVNRCGEAIGVAGSVVEKRIAVLGLPKFTRGRQVAG